MRVIIRRERPHPGAQLRFTDHNGNRLTAFSTNTRKGQLADLELRHHRRPLRRPHPRRQGHRPAQPALPGLRCQPDLAGHPRARPRSDRPAADPRPARPHRLRLGTESPTPASVLTTRAPGPSRPSSLAAPTAHRTRNQPSGIELQFRLLDHGGSLHIPCAVAQRAVEGSGDECEVADPVDVLLPVLFRGDSVGLVGDVNWPVRLPVPGLTVKTPDVDLMTGCGG